MDAWDKLKVLKEHPELANTSGYELKNLYAEADPIMWFLLLAEQPQFAPPHDWWFNLRCRTDLPWARLLAAQPQFAGHCHWESVDRGELVKLAFLAPELFARNCGIIGYSRADKMLAAVNSRPEYIDAITSGGTQKIRVAERGDIEKILARCHHRNAAKFREWLRTGVKPAEKKPMAMKPKQDDNILLVFVFD